MDEKKRPSRPNAHIRKKRRIAAARQVEAEQTGLGQGGVLLANDKEARADLNLIARAIRNGWPVPPEMVQHIPEKVLEVFDGEGRYKTSDRLAAVNLLLAMRRDNQNEVRLALQLREDRRKEEREGETQIHVNINNQTTAVATLTPEQRRDELAGIRARAIESARRKADGAVDGTGREAGLAQDVAPPADDPGRDAPRSVAAGTIALRFQ